jgi:hypothetical protein
MSENSLGMIQIRYKHFNMGQFIKTKILRREKDYASNAIDFLSFSTEEFTELLELAGFHSLAITRDVDAEGKEARYEYHFFR